MIVYITTHALTGIGIYKVEGRICSDGLKFESHQYGYTYGPDEWHRTWESAERRAQAMRDVEVARLNKQLDKLLSLTFTQPEDP